MLTPDYLEYCADDIVELYSRLDESIIRDIARRIVKTGNITDTAEWQIEKIQQGGYLYDDVIAEIARITGESENQVKTLFENAGLKSMEYDNAIYRKAGFVIPKDVMSAAAYQVLKAGAEKTSGNLRNLTMTTANTSQSAYINACTLAEMQIESGAFDYQTAIRNAVREAAKKGSMVSYPSGHTDRLDVAVRRAVLTGVSQTTGQVALQNARDMGCDLMEITAHSGARPSHQVWQGQLVSLSGKAGYFSLSDIGYGEGSGFKGWNCRHDWFPYFEGISERAYTNDDLKALEDETVTYNGKSYTEYAATQVQRAMEREIRSTRRELIGLDELIKGGDNGAKSEFENLSVKLKSQEAKLKDFCNKTDRKVDKFRVQVNGFNKSVSQKAVHTAKNHYTVWSKEHNINNSIKSLADYYGVKYNDKKTYGILQTYVKSVDKGMLSPLVGFDLYLQYYSRVENELIGLTTSNGIQIKSQSKHFLERVFGTMSDPTHGGVIRNGVELEDIKNVLLNGKVKPHGDSIVFSNNMCSVSLNPITGNLVQTQPKKVKK